jgi:hypothetical protein
VAPRAPGGIHSNSGAVRDFIAPPGGTSGYPRLSLKTPRADADGMDMLSQAPAMSNAERQRNFRARHPGYYSRRRIKFRPTVAALTAATAPVPAADPTTLAPPAEPAVPQADAQSRALRFAA